MADLWAVIQNEKNRQQAWDLYLEQFHYMVGGRMKYENFSAYFERVTGKNIDTRPDAEILAEVEAIRQEMKKGGE